MCGIFGAVSEKPLSLSFVVSLATFVNHRGHEAVGYTALGSDTTFLHFVGPGLVREACNINEPNFRQFSDEFKRLAPRATIGHTRYSTVGPSDVTHGQPIRMDHPELGPFFMAHNGQIPNHKQLRAELEKAGQRFITQSDSETLAAMIAHSHAPSLPQAVADVMKKVEGAYSLLLLSENYLIAARDPHGVWPLWQGLTADNTIVFASEEGSLGEVDLSNEIIPGTMVITTFNTPLNREPVTQSVSKTTRHSCWLNVAYLDRPDEGIGSTTVSQVRHELGAQLAQDYPANADIVVGIPDSGLDAASGYAAKSKIPWAFRGMVRNRFARGRSFILPGQSSRLDAIRDKQSATKKLVQGKRVVIVDDTIIRANTVTILTQMLIAAGASEIHWRIAAPPVRFPCYYGIDIPRTEELAAHRMSETELARAICADSVQYLPLESMMRVLNSFQQGWCTACVDGVYPISIGK